jgi:hypothetical protein
MKREAGGLAKGSKGALRGSDGSGGGPLGLFASEGENRSWNYEEIGLAINQIPSEAILFGLPYGD